MGVVHRDLKPANLMMTDSGAIKIMDFGIARVAGSDHLTQAGYMMGTPAYMAPEQVLGQEVDARADLYAIGVVLYRLVTGKLPFKGETPFAMAQSQLHDPPTPIRIARESTPAWVELLTARALAKSPADRFQTAEEFAQALRRGVSGLPIEATTAISPSAGTTTRAVALDAAAPTGAQPAGATGKTAGPTTITLKKRNVAAMAGVATVVVVLLTVVAAYFARTRTGNATLVPGSTPATAVPVQVPAPVEPAQNAPAQTPQPPGAAAAKPEAGRSSAPAPAAGTLTAPPARGRDAAAGAIPAPVPSGPPTASGRAAANDPHIAFVDVKVLEVKGTKADDRDVVLNLAAGQISLVSKKGGDALRSMPYAELRRITYSHSKDPQWDPSLNAPPAKLDVPGVFKSARHWLTFQSGSDYVILRLADENWASILQTIETRTGLTIDRRSAAK
jgi:hypothetical protein